MSERALKQHDSESSNPLPGAYDQLRRVLLRRIDSERIICDEPRRLAYGSDASFYRLLPKLVLKVDNVDELIFVLQSCAELNIPSTFRAAGTSLSGQAVSDSVLIALSDTWRGHRILLEGGQIALQPGVIGADANRYLARFKRKIGPDPASIDTCKIGGIAANNSSGMCCGSAHNSYHTMASMQLVLADGTELNTADIESIDAFRESHGSLLQGLQGLCAEVAENPELKQRIEHKYRLKNTCGYALNALVDYSDPITVLEHLMIGSEGTLGFISEITYNTLPDFSHKASSLLVFADIEQACHAVTALATSPVAAVELMDGRALRRVATEPGMPKFIRDLDLQACALLIESQADKPQTLQEQCAEIANTLADFTVIESVEMTEDTDTLAILWGMRKGLFPAVGAVREIGTALIIEDVAFPIGSLAAGVRDLQSLLDKYNYAEAIIFGHALQGNLHFVFTQSFDTEEEVARYGGFMDEVAHLVAVKYQGSLKAEHGTGRNMAPYVELEWGKEAYGLMQKIKALFDPRGLLNPGVILNEDPKVHLANLKPMHGADEIIDQCTECGYCEPVCPSRHLSLSPRQRIVLYRELQARRREGDCQSTQELEKAFQYQGIDTCVSTGLCSFRCPVGINTGDLVRKLRQDHTRSYERIGRFSAKHFAGLTALVKWALALNAKAQRGFGKYSMSAMVNGLRRLSGQRTPHWVAEWPQPNEHDLSADQRIQVVCLDGEADHAPDEGHDQHETNLRKVVYLPSCISRTMGQQAKNPEQRPLTDVTVTLLMRAGFEVIIPDDLSAQCCGMAFSSKGLEDVAVHKTDALEDHLFAASEQGRWPVLMDTSPCVRRSQEFFSENMEVYDPCRFALEILPDLLPLKPLDETVMLHITCSNQRMGQQEQLLAVAQSCARKVVVPMHIQCCGWAGDKGFSTPELSAVALAPLKEQVPSGCVRGFSTSRTCEIGLSHHSGVPYQSILYLLEEASRSGDSPVDAAGEDARGQAEASQ